VTSGPYTVHSRTYVEAPPDVVFDYFVVPEKRARWLTGELAEGRGVELARPERLKLDVSSGVVEVRLIDTGGETLVELEHSGLSDAEGPQRAGDWARYLGRLRVAATGADPGPDPSASAPWASAPGFRG